jgi:hypothetical protein
MSSQPYLLINKTSNVVENIVSWDGDINTWEPSANDLAIPQATTSAKIWLPNEETRNYELVEIVGAGDIGFTWDGSVLTTNVPQPDPLKPYVGTAQ